ncbi:MAG: caspase family protein [Pseudomonadota bacterium]
MSAILARPDAAPAQDASDRAADRIAVVVGNQDYDNIADLANARSDAEQMSTLLRSLGFAVFEGYNLDREGFETILRRAILNADPGAEIVFFYAGHGLQVGRRNYLLPKDAAFDSVYDLPVESVTLDRVIEALSASGLVHVAIIDACRDNPFPDAKLAGDLDASLFETKTGFDVFQTPLNSFVAFSTAPGMVAFDGEAGQNSPFTQAILSEIQKDAREPATAIFARVRQAVYTATDGRQVPWESSTLVQPFSFASDSASVELGTEVAAADGDVSAVARGTEPLPPEVSLSVPYGRSVLIGEALKSALGLAELPEFALEQAPGNGRLTFLPEVTYDPELSERRSGPDPITLTDEFVLKRPGSDAATLSVSLSLDVNPCDLLAGDALDPAGTGFYLLPNELDIERALAACANAVEAHPQEPRFHYQLARAEQAAGRYEEAFRRFEYAAEQGHIRAQTAVARLLTADEIDRELFDVPEDRERAFAALERGIAAADPFAMHLLGQMLLRDGPTDADRERGFDLLDRAAELGHTYSMNELGVYFLTESSAHHLPERGLRYLEASAARDDIYGFHNLGFVALYGLAGDEPDFAGAYTWFEKAALGGHPGSPSTIGRMIVRDEVPGSSAEDAVRWYDMGLSRGDAWGGFNAAVLILRGDVPELGEAQAIVRLAKAQHLADEEPAGRARERLSDLRSGDTGRAIQLLLKELGEDLVVDGVVGPRTRDAIARRAEAAGLAFNSNDPLEQLSVLGRAYWAQNPVRTDVF